MITLLDYGAGNVRSVANALESLGQRVTFVSEGRDITRAERLVFPGVGNFGLMMETLHRRGLAEPLTAYVRQGRPFLGICLGLQALFERSEEAPGVPGLGVFRGAVRRLRVPSAVPHIGWNGVRVRQPSGLFRGIRAGEKFYFVHSFAVEPEEASLTLGETDYGGRAFVSAVRYGNVVATQFHPEKSGEAGLALLRNFLDERPGATDAPAETASPTRLARRIVACLDVRSNDEGDLVVTKGDRYDVREHGAVRNLGRPADLARRYYEEGADEIAFLNITAFRDSPVDDLPMLQVLKETSQDVFVPLTIGGGIRDYRDRTGRWCSALDVAEAYFRSGADKVSIGSDAVRIVEELGRAGSPAGTSSIERIATVYGSQAVVVSIDPRRVYVQGEGPPGRNVMETEIPGPNGERRVWYQCTVRGGREGRDLDAVSLARACEELGAGEILLNSIDRDGTNLGFDLELIRAVKDAVSVPVIASSGAGRAEHFLEVFLRTDAESAVAAGIFHRREVTISDLKGFLAREVEVRQSGAAGERGA